MCFMFIVKYTDADRPEVANWEDQDSSQRTSLTFGP